MKLDRPTNIGVATTSIGASLPVIASAARQSSYTSSVLDCFVAALLAMTMEENEQ
jgi:hypothetical protein